MFKKQQSMYEYSILKDSYFTIGDQWRVRILCSQGIALLGNGTKWAWGLILNA